MAKKPFPFSVCEQCCPTGGSDIDLSGYVKKTDYATAEEAGIVKVQGNGIKINENYALGIDCADPNNEEQNNLPLSAGDSKQMFANALKGSASGASVFMDDVSPVEHEPTISVEAETPESVKLYACGKNMFSKDAVTELRLDNMETKEIDGDKYILKGNLGAQSFAWSTGAFQVKLPYYMQSPNYAYTASIYVTLLEQGDRENQIALFLMRNQAERVKVTPSLQVGVRTKLSVTYTGGKSINSFWILLNSNKLLIEYDTLQIECGKTATEYEAYNGQMYSVNADGTVEGVKLLHPVTYLTTDVDNENAVIHCDYNKDSNKVIEKLTNAIISLGGNV